MTTFQTNKFFNCFAVILTVSLLLFSCQSKNEQKEKELLQKENELLKKENELLQKEKNDPNNLLNKKTTESNSSISITKSDVEKAFQNNKSKIDSSDRDCWNNDAYIGDLNSDGLNDGLMSFACGFKDSMGNAIAGSGLAIFINNNGDLIYQGTEEDFVGFVPSKISSGLIYGDILEYAQNDARCCPSIKTKVKLKLANGKLVKVN